MEVPNSLMRKEELSGRADFGGIKFSSSPFASKMWASANQLH